VPVWAANVFPGCRSSWNRKPSGRTAPHPCRPARRARRACPTQSALPQIGCRWVERERRPLDLLAVIFLIDLILIWGFPDRIQ
jgi:hypothetical protein